MSLRWPAPPRCPPPGAGVGCVLFLQEDDRRVVLDLFCRRVDIVVEEQHCVAVTVASFGGAPRTMLSPDERDIRPWRAV